MSAAGSIAHVVPAVVGSWGLIFTLVGLAALLTVLGLGLMVRSRRRPPGGHR